jgi:ABC-type Mn2+/Zn2+ transport system permease subunit
VVDWLLEPFTCCAFMRAALVAGLITVVTTSLVGVWIVLRGMTFMGDALAHGVLPGITLAFILGYDLAFGAGVAALVMIAGVNVVHHRVRLPEDTGIGLLFVGMLALGVVIISRGGAFAGDLTAFLFGDAIGVTSSDIRAAAVAAVITIVLTVALYRPLIALAFNRRKAALLGLRPGLTHAALLGMLALAIISSFRAVGVLLVFGFIVAPPATASLVARRVPTMMLAAIGFGAFGVVSGLLISFHGRTATSATMAGMTVAVFFVVLAAKEVRDALVRIAAPRGAADSG